MKKAVNDLMTENSKGFLKSYKYIPVHGNCKDSSTCMFTCQLERGLFLKSDYHII